MSKSHDLKSAWLHQKFLKENKPETVYKAGQQSVNRSWWLMLAVALIMTFAAIASSVQLQNVIDKATPKEFAQGMAEELCQGLEAGSYINIAAEGNGYFSLTCASSTFMIKNEYTEKYYHD